MALTPEFKQKVDAIERRLGMEPGSLMAVMRFETGGEFSPSTRNRAGSGATGLIQFTRGTAQGLGTSTDALAQMSAEDQLEYVERYLSPYKGKLKTLDDAYMAVLYPKAIGKPGWYPLFSAGTKAYEQNAGLDRDKKGMVTKADAVARVRGSGEAPAPTMVAQAPSREAGPAPTPTTRQPAFTAQESAEPAAREGGTDWSEILFAGSQSSGGTGATGGTNWAELLFS